MPSPGQLSSDPPADGGAKASPVGDAKPAPWWQDPDHVPTMEEADAEVRSRPHGAVIAEICDDLRVLDSILHRAAWHELKDAIDSYGGDLARLQRSNWRRRFKPHRFPNHRRGTSAALAIAPISRMDACLCPPALTLRAGRDHRAVTRTGPATAGPAVAIRVEQQSCEI